MVSARRDLTIKNHIGENAGSRGGRISDRVAATTTAYTDSDNRLFDALMPPDQNCAAAPPQKPTPGSVQYTSQDLQNLHGLMPGEPVDEDHPAPARDRDAGHIRIIDFDKQHATDKESRRRGSVDLKIRYFD